MLPGAATALLLALASAQPAPATEGRDRGADAVALPLVNYNSDQGLGIGAVAGAYLYGPGFRPYRHAIGVQTFFTRSGVRNHFLRYDGPRLIGPLRLEARLEYRREFLSPYFGAGNLTAPDFGGRLEDPRFNYERTSPGGWLRLRHRPLAPEHPLELYAGYAFRQVSVRTYEGSLLAAQQPTGLEGGSVGQLWLGALWDTRDDEADPSAGGLAELSVRLAHRVTASDYGFAGVTLSARRFWSLGARVVLAQRLTFDGMVGDVPFFEWPNVGGVSYTEGIGGLSSVRGVERNRFAGNWKLISNSEARVRLAQFGFMGQPIRVGAVGFLDLGRVWHPEVDDGPWHELHPGFGLGLRAARRAAVVRGDVAWAPESGRRALYLTFGHMF